MNVAEILRKLADVVADHEGSADQVQNPARLVPAEHDMAQAFDADKTPSGNDKEPEDLFLPPLQQKQELLKKAVGVDNVYDDGTPSDPKQQSDTSDQEVDDQRGDLIMRIKKLSGIPVAAVQELSNDEPMDD